VQTTQIESNISLQLILSTRLSTDGNVLPLVEPIDMEKSFSPSPELRSYIDSAKIKEKQKLEEHQKCNVTNNLEIEHQSIISNENAMTGNWFCR
jgi:hypothetical protein